MIAFPSGVRVCLATGDTDMRKGFASLALQVQEVLHRDPLSGHLFCFRGRRGNLLKVILARWSGRVPVHEASGTRTILVAESGRRRCYDLIPTRDVAPDSNRLTVLALQ
jgi:IS66 Orf2 like protein